MGTCKQPVPRKMLLGSPFLPPVPRLQRKLRWLDPGMGSTATQDLPAVRITVGYPTLAHRGQGRFAYEAGLLGWFSWHVSTSWHVAGLGKTTPLQTCFLFLCVCVCVFRMIFSIQRLTTFCLVWSGNGGVCLGDDNATLEQSVGSSGARL